MNDFEELLTIYTVTILLTSILLMVYVFMISTLHQTLNAIQFKNRKMTTNKHLVIINPYFLVRYWFFYVVIKYLNL